MTPDPRIEVAAAALHLDWCREADPSKCDADSGDYAQARAVVAALDAHDAGLRERLAQAVEAERAERIRLHGGCCCVGQIDEDARIVRDTP